MFPRYVLQFTLLTFVFVKKFGISIITLTVSSCQCKKSKARRSKRDLSENAVAMRLCKVGLEYGSVLRKVHLYFKTSAHAIK